MTNNIYHVITYKDRVDSYEPPEALRKERVSASNKHKTAVGVVDSSRL